MMTRCWKAPPEVPGSGRTVLWPGDVPLFYVQDDVHPQIFDKAGPGRSEGPRGYQFGCWNNKGEAKIRFWVGVGDCPMRAERLSRPTRKISPPCYRLLLRLRCFPSGRRVAEELSPLHPWSGFITGFRATDMSNLPFQQSVYRSPYTRARWLSRLPDLRAWRTLPRRRP